MNKRKNKKSKKKSTVKDEVLKTENVLQPDMVEKEVSNLQVENGSLTDVESQNNLEVEVAVASGNAEAPIEDSITKVEKISKDEKVSMKETNIENVAECTKENLESEPELLEEHDIQDTSNEASLNILEATVESGNVGTGSDQVMDEPNTDIIYNEEIVVNLENNENVTDDVEDKTHTENINTEEGSIESENEEVETVTDSSKMSVAVDNHSKSDNFDSISNGKIDSDQDSLGEDLNGTKHPLQSNFEFDSNDYKSDSSDIAETILPSRLLPDAQSLTLIESKLDIYDDDDDIDIEIEQIYQKVAKEKSRRSKKSRDIALEDKILDLELENSKLKKNILLHSTEVGDLRILNSNLQEENRLLNLDLSEAREKQKTLTKWAEDNAVEVRQWKLQVDVLTSELELSKFYEQKLKEATLTIKNLGEELHESVEEKEKADAQVLQTQKNLADAKKEHAKEIALINKSLENSIKRANERIEEERIRGKEAILFVKSNFKSRIKELELEFEERRKEDSDMRNVVRLVEKKLKKCEAELENYKAEKSSDARINESLKRQIVLLKDRVDTLTQEKVNLEAEKINISRINEELQAEVEVSRSAQRRLERELKESVVAKLELVDA